MKYDASIIEEFSQRLYKKAHSVVLTYTALGAIIGLAGGLFAHTSGAVLGLIMCGGVGYMIGTEKAFQFKLQAQTALCQVQIEKNTGFKGTVA